MKKKHLVLLITTTFMFQMINGQKLEQTKVEQLKDVLNATVASSFKLELKNNQVLCSIDEFIKILDIRDSREIANDNLTKQVKIKRNNRPYQGPVYWKYNFETTTNSEVKFKANEDQQLVCTIFFKESDSIVIKSMLNAYTSNHKISDSAPHDVEWTGDKNICLFLIPSAVDSKIKFELIEITMSGKFERKDNYEISNNYIESLKIILKREFKILFESDEMTDLMSQKFKN